MQKIDFRTEYQIVSVISFGITFALFILLSSLIELEPGLPEFFTKFFLSLGIYLFIFRGLLYIYNKHLWRHFGYKDINISGYWHYRSYKSMTQTNTEGYAHIVQDMYGIQIHGFNIGSAGDSKAIAIWKTDNVVISRGVLNYDYELFAERPHRVSRVMKSKVTLNLYGSPPSRMVGTYIDLPIASKEETIRANLVGSIIYSKCDNEMLEQAVKNTFNGMLISKKKVEQEDKIDISFK